MSDRDAAEDAWRDMVRQMVERSCADQGVPVKITDPVTLRRVAVLLGAPPDAGPDDPR